MISPVFGFLALYLALIFLTDHRPKFLNSTDLSFNKLLVIESKAKFTNEDICDGLKFGCFLFNFLIIFDLSKSPILCLSFSCL